MTGTATAKAPRYPMLDSLRALATLWVFVTHISFEVGPERGVDNQFSLVAYLTQQNNRIFAPAIAVFFVLTGFLLYRPFAHARWEGRPVPAIRPYLARRFLRIVPAYWVALPIIALLLAKSDVFTPGGIVTYFGFLQIYTNGTFNGGIAQAWTLDVDVPFYLVLPLVALLFARVPVRGGRRDFLTGELAMLSVVVLGSMLWQAMVFKQQVPQTLFLFPGLLSLPGSIGLIASGMMLASASVAFGDSWPRPFELVRRYPWVTWVLALAIAWVLPRINTELERDHGILNWWVAQLLKALFAILLMLPAIIGHERRDRMRRALTSRVVRYMSDRSYAFYLWHLAAIDLLVDAGLRGSVGAVGLVAAALAATFTAAELSWRLVEQPALRLGRRVTEARSRRARELAAAAETPPR
jgi:peptidoglycan/LPS O-acetylase OafA/YrhL